MTTPVEFVTEVSVAVNKEIEQTFNDLEKIEGFGSAIETAETPTLAGVKVGAVIGTGIGAIYGGVVGGVVGAVVEYKKTVAVAAVAVVAFIYRDEIADFVGGKLSGTSAGGDAFM